MTHSSTAPPPLSRAHLIALLMLAAQAPLASTMIAVALPEIGAELSVDGASLTQLLAVSYLLVGIILQSPGGALGDVIGHIRSVTLGAGTFSVGCVTGLVAGGVTTLTAARVMMSAGAALMLPGVFALLRLHLPAKRRAEVFGWTGSVMGLAAATGPLLGGLLIAASGWRLTFAVSLPCLAAGIAITYRQRDRLQRATAPRALTVDWLGIGLLALGLGLPIIGIKGLGSPLVISLGVGGIALVGLWVWEGKTPQPIIDPRLLKRKVFLSSISVVGLQNMALYGVLFSMPHFFANVRGLPGEAVGWALLAMTGAMMICSPLGGRLARKLGTRAVAILGNSVLLLGLIALQRVETIHTVWDAARVLTFLGAGVGLATPACQNAAMTDAPSKQSGMAGGILSTSRYVGGVIAMALLGQQLAGSTASNPEAYQQLFSYFAMAAGAGLAVSFLLPGRRASTP